MSVITHNVRYGATFEKLHEFGHTTENPIEVVIEYTLSDEILATKFLESLTNNTNRTYRTFSTTRKHYYVIYKGGFTK